MQLCGAVRVGVCVEACAAGGGGQREGRGFKCAAKELVCVGAHLFTMEVC